MKLKNKRFRNQVVNLIKKTLSRLGLIITSFIFTLLSIELLLTIINTQSKNPAEWAFVNSSSTFYSLDPYRIYKINPNLSPWWPDDRSTDEFGFRSNPRYTRRQQGSKKIVMVGDSFTFGGMDIPFHETYPSILESELRSDGINVQVYNAGVPGYGLDQEFIYLRDEIIPKLKPDLIIWNFNINDFGDSNDACLFKKVDNSYRQISAKRNSLYFTNYYPPLFPPFVQQSRTMAFTLSLIPERFTIGCTKNKWVTNEEFADKVEFFLRQTKELTEEINSQLIVTIVLDQHEFVTNSDSLWLNESIWIHDAKLLYSQVAERAKVPIININNLINNNPSSYDTQILGYTTLNENSNLFLEETQFPIGWRHPNTKGNQIMGAVVAQQLHNLGILD